MGLGLDGSEHRATLLGCGVVSPSVNPWVGARASDRRTNVARPHGGLDRAARDRARSARADAPKSHPKKDPVTRTVTGK
jgi:hypothetical protein